MRLKSYFVHTMEEALQAAKVELGEDAMLVDSKHLQAPPGGRARLEVIFAAQATPLAPPIVETAGRPAAASNPVPELKRFRGELTSLLDALSRNPDKERLEPFSPAGPLLDHLRARLLLSEVPVKATDEMLQRCRPVLEGLVLRGAADDETTIKSVLPLLAAEWPHQFTDEAQKARAIALLGPTGVGKTSAIAKLAFRLGVSQGRTVSVLSVDNLRIGASDQLAHLCALLGVRFEALDYSGGLPSAVAAQRHQGIILIDTPGYSGGDIDTAEETAEHMGRIEALECQLVLPATLRYRDMQRRREQFSIFAPSRLLFTRLDETDYFGPAWALARDCGLPVEWMSTGPGIPEDLIEADASRVAAALLGHNSHRANISNSTQNLASAAIAGASRI